MCSGTTVPHHLEGSSDLASSQMQKSMNSMEVTQVNLVMKGRSNLRAMQGGDPAMDSSPRSPAKIVLEEESKQGDDGKGQTVKPTMSPKRTAITSDTEIVRTQRFDNGTVIVIQANGTRIQTTSDGVKLMQYKTGRTLQINLDGTKIERLPDGTKRQFNPDGSTITLSPQGTRTQINPNGVKIEVHADGTVEQTNVDGTVIRLNTDGSKEQVNPDQTTVRLQNGEDHNENETSSSQKANRGSSVKKGSQRALLSSNGSTETKKQSSPIKQDAVRPEQQLRVYKSGTKIQTHRSGAWKILIEEAKGTVLQKGFDGSVLMRDEKKCVFFDKDSLRTTAYPDGSVVEGEKDEKAKVALEKRIRKYEKHVEDRAHEFHEKLLYSERALVNATNSYEKQCMTLKTKLSEEKSRGDRLVKQLEMFKKKQKSLHSVIESGAQPSLPPLPDLPSERRKTCEAATQWSLSDAKSQFYDSKITQKMKDEADNVFKDPELARTVVQELQERIVTLATEKQEVEDRLIDLRFSLNEKRKKKKGTMTRMMKALVRRNQSKYETGKGPLKRNESLVAAVENLKRREEKAGEELTKFKRESSRLSSENENLKKLVAKLQKEKEEALERCTEMQSRVDDYLDSGDEDSAINKRASIEILPCIDEEMHMEINLQPVSPMI